MGSNMAEAHPVGFRWPMKAKERGATLIHVDPHFSRTSASCNLYVPIRSGSDIAFLGGLINYVLTNDLWFREYVLAYTNASSLINPKYRDAEEGDGLFSGFDPKTGKYDNSTWTYEGPAIEGPEDATSHSGHGQEGTSPAKHRPDRDETLQDPNCVFQILKRHYARYTPEMVEQICGTPKALFLQVADILTKNSGRERTSAICYAVGWTQQSFGPQIIRAAGILQLLLGNIGRPGGGIMALRGHASIQGSTDVPTLFDLLPGYLPQPASFKDDQTLESYLKGATVNAGYWSNLPKFMISLLKAWYGNAAQKNNDFGYDWLGKITGDHSHIATAAEMAEGKIKGFIVFGQNPAAGSPNAGFQRKALKQLDWLVTVDLYETETAAFWYGAPERPNPRDIKTEVFMIPAAGPAEKDGTFTNTQRLLQFHDKAVDPKGDTRSDTWFVYHLGTRLKALYRDSKRPRDQGLKNLTWDYLPERPDPEFQIKDEPSAEKILKEINGYTVADRKQLKDFEHLKTDGSTACGVWIYAGVFPEEGKNLARSRKASPDNYVAPEWGFAWPANRRILYNRAAADPAGKPWSERKKYIWWDAAKKRWTGLDVPDFPQTKAPNTPAKEDGTGMDKHSGSDPFSLKPDGRGWLFAPSGLKDGPLPTHYEPLESPVKNLLYKQQSSPVVNRMPRKDNPISPPGDPKFPYVATTYRVTEQYLSGVMSRWNSWLDELQPEMFAEISPELASEKSIQNTDWIVVSSARGEIECRALVTERMRPLQLDGQTVHVVGLPIHWGYKGLVKGAIVNDLVLLSEEPNVYIQEDKAFTCNIRKGRIAPPPLSGEGEGGGQ
jgi:formate dehydrogenase major subunit